MTAGGAQGLEFGPFPQNIARIKRRATTHNSITVLPDPDLFWNRKNRLVEGTYEVTAHMVMNSAQAASAVSVDFQWLFSDVGVAGDSLLALTGSTANLTTGVPLQQAVKLVQWVGNGFAQVQLPLDGDDELISVRFNGVMFIAGPTDIALGWAPSNAFPVELLASGIIRFALVR